MNRIYRAPPPIRGMLPSYLVPARNSRHRLACLTLYRALLREGQRVPLPDDLLDASTVGPRHPVKHLVRRGFQRNRADTSHKIVYAALSAGYRFLTLFSLARSPSSPEHASLVSFLRRRLSATTALRSSRSAHRANLAASRPPPPTPREPSPPLLMRVSAPSAPPSYASAIRPRPLFSLGEGKRRRVPRLCATSQNVPFLRLSKPQSPRLSDMLRYRRKKYEGRVDRLAALREEELADARSEDLWESLVLRLEAEQRRGNGRTGKAAAAAAAGADWLGESDGERMTGPGTYEQVIWAGVRAVGKEMAAEREDNIARARAMMKIVDEEKKFAAVEREAERKAKRARERQEGKAAGAMERPGGAK